VAMGSHGDGYRNVIRTEFPSGQLEYATEAARALGLPLEEFVRRATIEASNMVSNNATFASSWGSVRSHFTTTSGVI
jgi:hypothetical protein